MSRQSTSNTQSVGGQPLKPSFSHGSKKWVIAGSTVVIILAIALGFAYYMKYKQEYYESPAGKLELLRESSDPVNLTLEEMEANLQTPDAESVDSSREERLEELRALENL